MSRGEQRARPAGKVLQVVSRGRWLIPATAGALMHGGTALLRLGTFFPYPMLLGFAAFYYGAWAIRTGVSPYRWSPSLDGIRQAIDLHFYFPISPPAWLLPLVGLTAFPFPLAAALWLLLQLALVWIAARMLAGIAGRSRRAEVLTAFLVTLTFGPVFLNLTLGQCALFGLLAALLMGRLMRSHARRDTLAAACLWAFSATSKLFLVAWLGALPLLRRWRLLGLAVGFLFLLLAAGTCLASRANVDYWCRFLPERVALHAGQPSIDDQSLVAVLHRLTQPQSYEIAGLRTAERHVVIWRPAWSPNPDAVRIGGYALAGLLVLGAAARLARWGANDPEGGFYLWVLVWVLPFPHTERYNHVLRLPAMAWLWRQGARPVVAVAYLLVRLSRLTHLWTRLLLWPWALSAGFGLYAAVALGIAVRLRLALCPAACGRAQPLESAPVL